MGTRFIAMIFISMRLMGFANLSDLFPTSHPTLQPSSQPSRQPFDHPSRQPSRQPTRQPSAQPSMQPSAQPSMQPSAQPSMQPSRQPFAKPSRQPSSQPSRQPSSQPSMKPNCRPSSQPSHHPTRQPIVSPSVQPTSQPSQPTSQPSVRPTISPTRQPTSQPSRQPISKPSHCPSEQPMSRPSRHPSTQPSSRPTHKPSSQPSRQPSRQPTTQPSHCPVARPTTQPSRQPNSHPTSRPSRQPSSQPTRQPTRQPLSSPTRQPTTVPSCQPSCQPSIVPSSKPTTQPSERPSLQPQATPSVQPSSQPSCPSTQPSSAPSHQPSQQPTIIPSSQPSMLPTLKPTVQPSSTPSHMPSTMPSSLPSSFPSVQPSNGPSCDPTSQPSGAPSGRPSDRPTNMPTAAYNTQITFYINVSIAGTNYSTYCINLQQNNIALALALASVVPRFHTHSVEVANVLEGVIVRANSSASQLLVIYRIIAIVEEIGFRTDVQAYDSLARNLTSACIGGAASLLTSRLHAYSVSEGAATIGNLVTTNNLFPPPVSSFVSKLLHSPKPSSSPTSVPTCGMGSFGLPEHCAPCPPGSFTSVVDGLGCNLCPYGQFTASYGSSECQHCTYPHFTYGTGFTSCTAWYLNFSKLRRLVLFIVLVVVYIAGVAQAGKNMIPCLILMAFPSIDILTDLAYILTNIYYDKNLFFISVFFFVLPNIMFLKLLLENCKSWPKFIPSYKGNRSSFSFVLNAVGFACNCVLLVGWATIGIFFFQCKILAIDDVWNAYFYFCEGVKRKVGHEVRDVTDPRRQRMVKVNVDNDVLNKSLFAEFVLETLPQLAIQSLNNTLINEWSSVGVFSSIFSAVIALNGLWRYGYQMLVLGETWATIPNEISLSSTAQDTTADGRCDCRRFLPRRFQQAEAAAEIAISQFIEANIHNGPPVDPNSNTTIAFRLMLKYKFDTSIAKKLHEEKIYNGNDLKKRCTDNPNLLDELVVNNSDVKLKVKQLLTDPNEDHVELNAFPVYIACDNNDYKWWRMSHDGTAESKD